MATNNDYFVGNKRGRPKGSKTGEGLTRKEYNKRYYEKKKERQELDEINGAGTIQAMNRLHRAINLFGDEDDIKKKDELQKEIARAEMEYAHKTGDYSGLKGYIFEM